MGSGEGGGVQISGRRCFKRNQGAQKETDADVAELPSAAWYTCAIL